MRFFEVIALWYYLIMFIQAAFYFTTWDIHKGNWDKIWHNFDYENGKNN